MRSDILLWFSFAFSLVSRDVDRTRFQVLSCHLCIFFGDTIFLFLCPFSNRVFFTPEGAYFYAVEF